MEDFRDKIIQEIVENIEVKEGKLSVSNHQKVDRLCSILISELLEKDRYQKKFDEIQYLGYSDLQPLVFIPPFKEVFVEMKLEGGANYEIFKSKVDYEISEIKEHLKIQNYCFLYPVRLKLNILPKNNTINGILVEFKKYDEIASIFSDITLLKACEKFQHGYSIKFYPNAYLYLKITSRARNLWYAERRATKIAQFVVGVITYVENYRRMKSTLIGPIRAISDLNIELILPFSEQGFEGILFNSINTGTPPHELSDDQIEHIDEIFDFFKNSHKTVRDVIQNGLISYHSGLIETRMGHAFLNFWTAAEVFCLKNKNITEKEMINRLLSPIKNKNDIIKHELERLYEIRNAIVHNAEYELATEFDRNIMQFYVEPFIDFFIDTLSKFPRIRIEKILQYLQDSDESLNEDRELIDFVRNLRNQE